MFFCSKIMSCLLFWKRKWRLEIFYLVQFWWFSAVINVDAFSLVPVKSHWDNFRKIQDGGHKMATFKNFHCLISFKIRIWEFCDKRLWIGFYLEKKTNCNLKWFILPNFIRNLNLASWTNAFYRSIIVRFTWTFCVVDSSTLSFILDFVFGAQESTFRNQRG